MLHSTSARLKRPIACEYDIFQGNSPPLSSCLGTFVSFCGEKQKILHSVLNLSHNKCVLFIFEIF